MNNDSPLTKNAIYSVSQLNRETKEILSQYFMTVRVEGEISNLSTPASGHIYFTLKDANAQIRCALFRSYRRQRMIKPENGQMVIAKAQVGLYEARGDYQLIVESIEPAGDGALLKAFELLKTKLTEEGLFAAERKQSLPMLPSCIGVITSPTGAAVQDILAILQRRFPATSVIIYPAAVQGQTAATEIISALSTANARKECDLLIIARGGGSLEDLNAFNDEALARAIAASTLPIISAIGHETDFTIADFVADHRAATPSAAAETAVPNASDWINNFAQLQQRITRQCQQQLLSLATQLNWLQQRLQQKEPNRDLQAKAQRLDELNTRLLVSIKARLQNHQAALSTQIAKLAQHNPAERLKYLREQQLTIIERLETQIRHQLKNKHQQLLVASQTLHAVSPLATLNRGYALVTHSDSDQVVSSTKQLSKDDVIKTQLADGLIISQIQELVDA